MYSFFSFFSFFNCSQWVREHRQLPRAKALHPAPIVRALSPFFVWSFQATVVENVWSFQKGAGVLALAPFQAINNTDGTRHSGNQENGGEVCSGQLCPPWAECFKVDNKKQSSDAGLSVVRVVKGFFWWAVSQHPSSTLPFPLLCWFSF